MGRFKGVATVRRCIEHSVATSDSPYETLARGLLIDAHITHLETQVSIDGWLIVEIDGEVKYAGSDAERTRQREFRRQKAIANRGYVFLRYSPADLLRDPAGFVAEVKDALAHRAPRFKPRR